MKQEPSHTPKLDGWWSERDEVGGLVRKLVAALQAKETGLVGPAFSEFERVVRDHLRIEEEVVFPTALRTHPEQAPSIRSLRIAHIGIRDALDRISEQIELSHSEAVREMLEAFIDSFSAHERLEDQLVGALRGAKPV